MSPINTVALAALAASGLNAKTVPAGTRDIEVCLQLGSKPLIDASLNASAIFHRIQVNLVWVTTSGCAQDPDIIAITLSFDTPKRLHPGALAYAKPFEGTRIVVMMDRVECTVPPDKQAKLLTYVLVHEITHILQGVAEHAPQGIMKAHWTLQDHHAMWNAGLNFTPGDIQLIHLGINARLLRGPRVTFASAVQ